MRCRHRSFPCRRPRRADSCAPEPVPLATCVAPAPLSAFLRSLWCMCATARTVGYLRRTCTAVSVLDVSLAVVRQPQPAPLATCVAFVPLPPAFLRSLWCMCITTGIVTRSVVATTSADETTIVVPFSVIDVVLLLLLLLLLLLNLVGVIVIEETVLATDVVYVLEYCANVGESIIPFENTMLVNVTSRMGRLVTIDVYFIDACSRTTRHGRSQLSTRLLRTLKR